MNDDVKGLTKMLTQAHAAFAGHPPELQGVVLAELLSRWLAGHNTLGSPAETDALRNRLLDMHINTVRALIPITAAQLHGEKAP